MKCLLLISAAIGTLALPNNAPANPAVYNLLAERAVTTTKTAPLCSAVSAVVSVLKASSATPFCSSFLGIQTSTVTAAATVTSSIPSTSISLATSTATVQSVIPTTTTLATSTIQAQAPTAIIIESDVASTTIIQTITSGPQTVTAGYLAKRSLERRATSSTLTKTQTPIATPIALKLLASAAISTICSCLGVPTPTITVTATSTVQTTYLAATSVSTIATSVISTQTQTISVTAFTTTTTTPLTTATSIFSTFVTTTTTAIPAAQATIQSPAFSLQIPASNPDGIARNQYITQENGYAVLTIFAAQATQFVIGQDGFLRVSGQDRAWYSTADTTFRVWLDGSTGASMNYMKCTLPLQSDGSRQLTCDTDVYPLFGFSRTYQTAFVSLLVSNMAASFAAQGGRSTLLNAIGLPVSGATLS